MAEDDLTGYPVERRSEPRKETDRLFRAEIRLPVVPIHLLKLKDISLNGACVLIKEDSLMLNHLKAGQSLKMKYTSPIKPDTPTIKSEIKHITKAEKGRFKDHYLVGLFIPEKLSSA